MVKTRYEHPKPCGATLESISDFARKIGKALDLKPGMDLEPIVSRLNGVIEYLPLTTKSRKQASITVEKGGKFTIRLSAALFPLQKRMSIAHELGHLFLHSRYGEVSLVAYHDAEGESKLVEEEAHEFACTILMPTKLLRQAAKALENDSIRVAAYFMVPEPVARQRMLYVGC